MPPRAGIGLREPHRRAILGAPAGAGWLEVHSENYFACDSPAFALLERARAIYPVSLHGVGLSLGSADPLSRDHLGRLRALAARIEPALVSEHLSWSSVDGRFLNDLLPLPYTDESLAHVCARIAEAQDFLGRRLLVENVSSYVQFGHSTIPEWELVAAVSRRTGCGLVLDVNNVYVSAANHGFAPRRYLDAIPAGAVAEIHLAGHERRGGLLLDTHSAPVCEEVWSLYREAISRLGPVPTLIEWDHDIPELGVLLAEARKAGAILEEAHAFAH